MSASSHSDIPCVRLPDRRALTRYSSFRAVLLLTDETKHQGDITYLPVSTTRWYWQLQLDSINVGGQVAVTPPENYIKEAIIDTGSTLIAGPKADVEKFWST